MKTENGLEYKLQGGVLTLYIPKTKGIHSKEVHDAKSELIFKESNGEIPYFKEITVKKK